MSWRKTSSRLKGFFHLEGHKKTAGETSTTPSGKDGKTNCTSSSAAAPAPEDLEPAHLWEKALDKLRQGDETRKLVDAYERDLVRQALQDASHRDTMRSRKVPVNDLDPHRQLPAIVDGKLQEFQADRLKEEVVIREPILKIVDFILSAKYIIGSAVTADPHAALAWAGILLFLSVLLNPITQAKDVVEGIEYISDLLVRCAVTEDTYLKKQGSTHTQSSPELQHLRMLKRAFVTKTVDLYAQILEYQIRLAKHISRSGFCRFFAGLVVTDDWKAMLTNVKDIEGCIKEHLSTHDRNTLDKIHNIVSSLHGHTEEVLKTVRNIERELEHNYPLKELPYAEGAAFDSKNNKHDQCLDGTRTRLLEEIEDWSKNANAKSIFWLKGVAGTGKSTIARTVAYKFAERNSLGASFFFLRGKEDRGNARLFVTTLARQLSERQPALKQYICQAIVDRSTIADKGLNEQWAHLIIGPLSQVKGSVPSILIFVIDALDECRDKTDIRDILYLVARVREVKAIQVRVFVTSRPDAPVNSVFHNIDETVHYDLALHKVPEREIRRDIYFFLKHKMAKVKNDKGIKEEWPADKDINILIQRADRLFIYAAIVCRFIENSRFPKDCLSKILQVHSTSQSSTTELDAVYLQIVEPCVIDSSVPDERDELISLFREVVGSVVILFDPLSTSDLSRLLDVSSEKVSGTLEPLHSVLDISEDEESSIQPFHLSFRDFLLDNKRCSNTQFWIDEDKAHSNLVSRCIKIMSGALKKDICMLGELDCLVSGIDQNLIKTGLPAHIQYACRYWIRHLQRTEIRLHYKEILDFLRDHFLHWLEALSLMQQISEGVLVIQALKSMLTSNQHPELYKLVNDARLFLLSFKSVIEEAPLQAYHSAIVFSPTSSVIRNQFLQSYDSVDSVSTQIKNLPKVEDWNPSVQACKQALEGHTGWIWTVAFSNDSLLASGSDDKTIRVWDPMTGECKQTLEGHTSSIRTVAFSNDGLLASGSDDKTVRVWDPTTGECKQTLEGHTDLVSIVAFSNNSLLVSGSGDKIVRVWDPTTGGCKQILKGHTDSISTVAVSNDGLLASGSGDRTVRVWDPMTGGCKQTLEGHTSSIRIVAFSNDGLLASGSDDRTVRVWDPMTGRCKQMLEGHTSLIRTVAFSNDGLLVSGSDDRTVRVWDPTTGRCKQTLEGHSDSISTVAFSNDGLLASGSGDKTVRVWDPTTGRCKQTLEGHTRWIWTVAFSNDGLLASGSDDRTVRVWDPTTSGCKQTLEGHTGSISTVAFSNDGLLASGSGDETVRVWDSTTGECKQTLKGHTGWIWTVAFSNDGLLASGSGDKTVRVWDPTTGECKQTLVGHTDLIWMVAFSNDGLLASGSDDETVRVWDPTTGRCKQILEGHTRWIWTVAFSNDGLLASGSGDKTVRVWDPATGRCKQTLEGHSDSISTVAFSNDGLLASESDDKTVRVWDLTTGECKKILNGKLPLEFSSLSNLQPPLYSLSGAGKWIARSNRHLLLLPEDHRPVRFAVKGNILAIARYSGQLTFLEFSSDIDSLKI